MGFHRAQPLRTRPSVSVVIPCYNYGHLLPEAVHSVLDQDGLDVDVLVIDDCSTDDSAEVAQNLARHVPQVNALNHQTNHGHISTYNEGLGLVRGDYVVLLSADDLLPRDALTRAVTLMEAHPRVGLVYGRPQSFTDTAPPPPPDSRAPTHHWSVWPGDQWLRRITSTSRNVVLSPEVVMRREAWQQIGAYDPRLPHAADMAVWLQTALRWDIGRVNGPVQAFYRVHGANMHLNLSAGMMLTDLRERRLVFDLLAEQWQPRHPDADRLRERARRALARTGVHLGLGEGVGGDPGVDPQPFLDFAAETWPAVRETRLWRRAQRQSRSGVAVTDRTAALATKVRWHATHQRLRHFGT
jgi:hypothetical protein